MPAGNNAHSSPSHPQGTFAVIDFETTGISPECGARPTEIGVVILEDGVIVDTYESLMNPGVHIPYFIQELTGITDSMVRHAPDVGTVMQEVTEFIASHRLVAHNAAFDSKFLDAELIKLKRPRDKEMLCSLMLSRRVFPEIPSHKLSSLVETLRLPSTKHHRALADATAAAHLLMHIQRELEQRFDLDHVSHEMLLSIQQATRAKLEKCIAEFMKAPK